MWWPQSGWRPISYNRGVTEDSVLIRRADVSDAADVADLAARTFVHTYGSDNEPANIDRYTRRAFNNNQVLSELRDPGIHYRIAEVGHRAVGYAVLRDALPPEIDLDGKPIELARMYVEADRIGEGIGSLLIQDCLKLARGQGFDTIWLGVWRHNSRAVGFYRKWKFEVVGTQKFVMGRDVQVDYVMARPLEVPH